MSDTHQIIEVRVPCENVNDPVATIVAWHVDDGGAVGAGDVVVELETSKAVFGLQTPSRGIIRRFGEVGQDVPIGEVVFCVVDSEDAVAVVPAWVRRSDGKTLDGFETTRFSRAAKELMAERQVDESRFAGRGLVRRIDVLRELGEAISTCGSAVSDAIERGDAVHVPVAGVAFTTHALSSSKRAEIRSLRQAAASTLLSQVTVACPSCGFRKAADERFLGTGLATVTVVYEMARVLRQFPMFNAFYDGQSMATYDAVNIGVAINAGRGLKVLTLHDADRKSLRELASEFQEKVLRYLDDAVTVGDVTGATFSITDLSASDVSTFQPMLPQGQSAILGIGAEYATATGRGFNLVLAFDHQLSEGQQAAKCVCALRDRLASYERMISDEE